MLLRMYACAIMSCKGGGRIHAYSIYLLWEVVGHKYDLHSSHLKSLVPFSVLVDNHNSVVAIVLKIDFMPPGTVFS